MPEETPVGEIPPETLAVGSLPVTLPLGPPPIPAPALPVTVKSLVARTFAVWSRNVWRFLGYSLLMMVPLLVIYGITFAALMAAAVAVSGPEEPKPAIVGVLVAVASTFLVAFGVALQGGVTYGAVQTLEGRPVRFGVMLSAGFRRLVPMLGAVLLAGLLVWLGLLLALVPGVILACGFAAVSPLVVVERVGPIAAMKRSWQLTRGRRRTLFFTALVMALAAVGLSLAGVVLQRLPVVGLVTSLALNLAIASLFTVWPAVAYHDLRVEKEGAAGTDDLGRVFE
jgi:hypothetical protein